MRQLWSLVAVCDWAQLSSIVGGCERLIGGKGMNNTVCARFGGAEMERGLCAVVVKRQMGVVQLLSRGGKWPISSGWGTRGTAGRGVRVGSG